MAHRAVAKSHDAAGVGGNHAANGAAAARGEINARIEALRQRRLLQRAERRAGLNDRDAGEGVDLLDAGHGAKIANDLAGHGAGRTREPGAPALGDEAQSMRGAEPHQPHHLGGIGGAHKGGGAEIAPVEAGIAASELGLVPDSAGHLAQFCNQCLVAHAFSLHHRAGAPLSRPDDAEQMDLRGGVGQLHGAGKPDATWSVLRGRLGGQATRAKRAGATPGE